MRVSMVICLVIAFSFVTEVNSGFRLRRALKKVEKVVKNVVVKPIKYVVKHVIEKPVKTILKAVGLKKKVKKTQKEFQEEVQHARVVFTENSYRVEKITAPCSDGHHDIVKTEKPVEIHFEDKMVVLQDSFCRKCGQHFYTQPRDEL